MSGDVAAKSRRQFESDPQMVVVCVEPTLRSQLERAARENERSMSAEVRLALRRHLTGTNAGGK